MRRGKVVSVFVLLALLLSAGSGVVMADPPSPLGEDPGGGGGRIWEQYAEKESGTTNQTFATYYYTSQYSCDEEPDFDYVFVYHMGYQQNPDSIRFYADYWRVLNALPDALKDFALAWTEVRLCIGPDRVTLAGGPEAIKAHVWLHQK